MMVKTLFRNSIAQILLLTGISAPERCSRGRFSIVTFHRVLPDADRLAYPFPGLVVTPDELDTFLSYFTQHFDCGDLDTQHERYQSGEITARPLLAITFDDAQYDNYKYARPVLAKYNVKASFFVPIVAVERQELLMQIFAATGLTVKESGNLVSEVVGASKELTLESRLKFVASLVEISGTSQTPEFARLMPFGEIRELADDGHEIGSHSMTHCLMPECDDRALAYEVAESRHVLQARLGKSIASFCYPNVNADVRTAQAVAQADYSRAVTTTQGRSC